MKKYHLQVRYSIDGWVNQYPNEVYSEKELLGWTNVVYSDKGKKIK